MVGALLYVTVGRFDFSAAIGTMFNRAFVVDVDVHNLATRFRHFIKIDLSGAIHAKGLTLIICDYGIPTWSCNGTKHVVQSVAIRLPLTLTLIRDSRWSDLPICARRVVKNPIGSSNLGD